MFCVSINTAGPKDRASAEVHVNVDVVLCSISCECVNFRLKCAEIVFVLCLEQQPAELEIPLCFFPVICTVFSLVS